MSVKNKKPVKKVTKLTKKVQKSWPVLKTLQNFTVVQQANYILVKKKTTAISSVSKGAAVTGRVYLLELYGNPKDTMVAVIQNGYDLIKTSPVRKILAKTDKYLDFKTESGSVYRLSKQYGQL